MHLAGIPLRRRTSPGARPPGDDGALGSRLETAYGRMTKVLARTIPERETIIRALDEAPPGLEELRAVLLREHVGPRTRRLGIAAPGGHVAFATIEEPT